MKAVSSLAPPDLRRLKRIFDVGFNWSPARRWQSVQTIVNEIRQLFESDDASTTSLSFTDQLADLKDRITSSPETELLTTLKKLEDHLLQSIQQTAHRLSTEFSGLLSITPRGSHRNQSKREYHSAWRLNHRLKSQVSVDLVIDTRLENAELVVGGTFANIEVEPTRLGVFDPQAEELVDRAVQGLFLTVAEHVLK